MGDSALAGDGRDPDFEDAKCVLLHGVTARVPLAFDKEQVISDNVKTGRGDRQRVGGGLTKVSGERGSRRGGRPLAIED